MLNKTLDLLDRCVEAGTSVMFSVMLAIVVMGVIFRYFLNAPLSWSEEIPRYIMVWMTFTASSIALKRKQHIGMVFFVEKCPPAVRKILAIISNLLIIIFLLVAMYQGYLLAEMVGGDQRTPMANIPMAWLYLSIPVACLLMIIQLIRLTLAEIIQDRRTNKHTTQVVE